MVETIRVGLDKVLKLPLSLLISLLLMSGTCATAWALTASQVTRNTAAIKSMDTKQDIQNERWIRVDEGMRLLLERTK